MVKERKEKYESGESAQCYTRNATLRELQLPLKDCRKLCILTDIYPRESYDKKYDQNGDSWFKTLHYEKDIQFLLPEPIIWKLRELKYESGESAQCYTRNATLRELQLPLKDCRKLCILTEIYPRESYDKKYDQNGDSWFKTLHYEKDIQFLLPEPIIWKLRELKLCVNCM